MGKGVAITYNQLNLPKLVSKASTGKIHYIYDTTGNKLAQSQESDDGSDDKLTEYCGNFIYEDGELVTILTEEGRLVPAGDDDYTYEYNLKDHLGNTRAWLLSLSKYCRALVLACCKPLLTILLV